MCCRSIILSYICPIWTETTTDARYFLAFQPLLYLSVYYWHLLKENFPNTSCFLNWHLAHRIKESAEQALSFDSPIRTISSFHIVTVSYRAGRLKLVSAKPFQSMTLKPKHSNLIFLFSEGNLLPVSSLAGQLWYPIFKHFGLSSKVVKGLEVSAWLKDFTQTAWEMCGYTANFTASLCIYSRSHFHTKVSTTISSLEWIARCHMIGLDIALIYFSLLNVPLTHSFRFVHFRWACDAPVSLLCPFLQSSKWSQPMAFGKMSFVVFTVFILTSALSVTSLPADIEKGRRKVVHVLGKDI